MRKKQAKILFTTALMTVVMSMLISRAHSRSKSFIPTTTPFCDEEFMSLTWSYLGEDVSNWGGGQYWLGAPETGIILDGWTHAGACCSPGWLTCPTEGRGSVSLDVSVDWSFGGMLEGAAYIRVDLFVLQFKPIQVWSDTRIVWADYPGFVFENLCISVSVPVHWTLSRDGEPRYIALGVVSVGAWGARGAGQVNTGYGGAILEHFHFWSEADDWEPGGWEPYEGPEIRAFPMIVLTDPSPLTIEGAGFTPNALDDVMVKATSIPPATEDIEEWPALFSRLDLEADGSFDWTNANFHPATAAPWMSMDGICLVGAKDDEGLEAVTVLVLATDTMYPWLCDLNRDGLINIIDISMVARDFGQTWPPPDWEEEEGSSNTTNDSTYLFIPPIVITVPSIIYVARRKRKVNGKPSTR